MNGIGLFIESVVAILLMLTIGYCMMLNRRLKLLKADEDTLRGTIAELRERLHRHVGRACASESIHAEQGAIDPALHRQAGPPNCGRWQLTSPPHLKQDGYCRRSE